MTQQCIYELQIVKDTPAFARASAQPNPNPLEDAHTIAFFPLMPKSIKLSLCNIKDNNLNTIKNLICMIKIIILLLKITLLLKCNQMLY